MKKVALFLALIMLFSCLLPAAVHAQTTPEPAPKTLLEVLAEAPSDAREVFNDCELISPDEVLVPTYQPYYWDHDDSVAEIIENAKTQYTSSTHVYADCFAISKDKVKLLHGKITQDGSEGAEFSCVKEYTTKDIPGHLADIINGSASQIICGVTCNILDVICFDREFGEILTLYITDQGTFARIYKRDTSSGRSEMLEITENDLSPKLSQYQDIKKKWDSEGEVIFSFMDFLGGIYEIEPHERKETPEPEPEPNIFQKYLALWIAIPCILVLAGGTTAFFLVRKRRKQKRAEE